MKPHPARPSNQCEAYGRRWYFAPMSLLVAGMAVLQLADGDDPVPTAGLAASALAMSAEFPPIAEPVAIPGDLAVHAGPGRDAEVTAMTGNPDDNHAATF